MLTRRVYNNNVVLCRAWKIADKSVVFVNTRQQFCLLQRTGSLECAISESHRQSTTVFMACSSLIQSARDRRGHSNIAMCAVNMSLRRRWYKSSAAEQPPAATTHVWIVVNKSALWRHVHIVHINVYCLSQIYLACHVHRVSQKSSPVGPWSFCRCLRDGLDF